MTLQEQRKAKKTIQAVARREGKSVREVRAAMQEALDDAWATAWTPGNISGQVAWQRLFPGGKPTVEELICGIAQAAQDGQQPPALP